MYNHFSESPDLVFAAEQRRLLQDMYAQEERTNQASSNKHASNGLQLFQPNLQSFGQLPQLGLGQADSVGRRPDDPYQLDSLDR